MAFYKSNSSLAEEVNQSANRLGALTRKVMQANLADDKIDAAVTSAISALSKYTALAQAPLYDEGFTATLTQAAAPTFTTPLAWARTSGVFEYWGYAVSTTVSTSYVGSTPASTANAEQFKISFESDSESIAIKLVGVNTRLTVFVDGMPTSLDNVVTPSDGQIYIYELKFASQKNRKFEIAGFNMAFGAVWTLQNRYVRLPQNDTRKRVWQLGDSYTHGVGSTAGAINDFRLMCDYFGWNGLASGIGGSGWLTTGNGMPATRVAARIPNISFTPELVFLSFGYNDRTTDAAKLLLIEASIRDTVAKVRELLPKASIIGIGCATPLGGTATLAAVQAVLTRVYADLKVPMVNVYDLVNTSNFTFYSINSTDDQDHPNNTGFRFRAKAIVEQVRNFKY